MVVALHDVGKREHANLVQIYGAARGTLPAGWRLVKDERKFLAQPANCLERRMCCLDVRQTRPRRNETEHSRSDGIGYQIVVAARRVDDCQRAPPSLEGS